MRNLSAGAKHVRLPLDGTSTYVGAAGTSDLTSEGLDTLGYQSVLIMIGFGAIVSGAATSIKAQQSSDDGATDGYSDIANTAQTVADDDDNQVFLIDIHRPGKRYLDVVIDRGTQNATVDFIHAILYNAIQETVTQPAIIGGAEQFNTPAEGTA